MSSIKLASSKQKKKYAKYLASGEELIAVLGISDRFYWSNFFSFSLLSVFVIGLPFLLKLVHYRHSRRYFFTNHRVIIRQGIFSVETISAPYSHIARITTREGFLQRLGYSMGDVVIQTTGPAPVEIHLLKVSQPLQVKNLLEELITKEKHQYQTNLDKQKLPLVKPLE